jgi:hypothetical protein
MKTNKLFLFIAVLSTILFPSCNTSKRDSSPKELIGGLELLSSEQTGVDFNNSIIESEKQIIFITVKFIMEQELL